MFVSLIPLHANAQNQDVENTGANEEVTTETASSETTNVEETVVEETVVEETSEEVIINEETNIIEESSNEVVNSETQSVQREMRAVTYPARISAIFPDANFAQVIATELGLTVSTSVTKAQLNGITMINGVSKNIVNLQGLDELSNLTSLNLAGNNVADISTVDWTKLSKLIRVDFTQNKLTTLGPNSFNGLTNLEILFLGTNQIVDLSQVNWAQFTKLQILGLYFNKISDISTVPWDQMPALNDLRIFNNHISDISSVPCDQIKVDAKNQTITLEQLLYTSPLLRNNPIVSYTGISSPIKTVSNAGTYDETSKVITWDVPNGTTSISFTWEDTEASVGGTTKQLIFSGTATIPVEVKYNLIFKNHDGSEIEKSLQSVGATINEPTTIPGKTGYTFTGWTPTLAATMPAEDVTYTAVFTANTNTPYQVEYYQEQLDGSYIMFEALNFEGTTASTVNATINTYVGFTHDATNTNNILNGTVADDGSLVLKVYYTRNTYSVTYKDYDGTVLATFTGKYGTPYDAPPIPTRYLHLFSHWSEVVRAVLPRAVVAQPTIPAYHLIFIANYNPITEPPTPEVVNPVVTPETGRTCQDDGYPNGYYWNGTACVLEGGYKVPNTGVK